MIEITQKKLEIFCALEQKRTEWSRKKMKYRAVIKKENMNSFAMTVLRGREDHGRQFNMCA